MQVTTTNTKGTVTTTTVTTSATATSGGKVIGIVLMVFGSLGILLGLVSIIYSAIGINLALEGSGVEAMQKKCALTFASTETATYVSFDTGICSGNKATVISGTTAPNGAEYTDKMCGNDQSYVGCSYLDHKSEFTKASGMGTACTIAAGLISVIGSIPILLNGIFSFLNKEQPARISGGCGVGLSVPSVIAISICAIVLLVATGLSHLESGLTQYVGDLTLATSGLCSPQCKEALTGTSSLATHKAEYFGALTWLAVCMIILMLLESIFACVSCCTWRRKMRVSSTTTAVQPQVIQAVVVENKVVKTEVE